MKSRPVGGPRKRRRTLTSWSKSGATIVLLGTVALAARGQDHYTFGDGPITLRLTDPRWRLQEDSLQAPDVAILDLGQSSARIKLGLQFVGAQRFEDLVSAVEEAIASSVEGFEKGTSATSTVDGAEVHRIEATYLEGAEKRQVVAFFTTFFTTDERQQLFSCSFSGPEERFAALLPEFEAVVADLRIGGRRLASASRDDSREVPFYELAELPFDALKLRPHRTEFTDYLVEPDAEPVVIAWRYFTFEHVHNWGSRDTRISDLSLSWNGTGTDEVLVRSDTMAVKYRLTPWALPIGMIISSHRGRTVSVAAAMPEGASIREETDGIETWDRDPTRRTEEREPRLLEHEAVLAYSAWPYALAQLHLSAGHSFVLPGYEHMTDREEYGRIAVGGSRTVVDVGGRRHQATEVMRFLRPTLEEARKIDPASEPGRFNRYLIADSAPYFLGVETIDRDEEGNERLVRSYELRDFEILGVTSSRQLQGIVEQRRRLQQQYPHRLWFLSQSSSSSPTRGPAG